MQPRVLILRAPGTNCDKETAFAFERAGAATETLHVNRLLERPALFESFQILCIPGGFSYGDDVAAGRILACQLEHHLADRLAEFKDAGKLILGICNGFQVLLKAGVLLESDGQSGLAATLAFNDSGRFEDRWVRLGAAASNCVFLAGIESMYLPVAHAEGKFVAQSEDALAALDSAGQLVLRYQPQGIPGSPGSFATGVPKAQEVFRASGTKSSGGCATPIDELSGLPTTVPYPDNPNGSMADVAGICDTTGRVFGLMPHPERHIDPTQHPRWTRGEAPLSEPGMG